MWLDLSLSCNELTVPITEITPEDEENNSEEL